MPRPVPKLPGFTCKPGCSACCRAGPVPFTPVEKERVAALRPDLKWEQWAEDWVLVEATLTFTCPLLTKDGLCSIHLDRPLRCEGYGVVKDPHMTCKMGGKPDRMISNHVFSEIMERTRYTG